MAYEKKKGIRKPDFSGIKHTGEQAQRALQRTGEQTQKNLEQMKDNFAQAVVQPVYKEEMENSNYMWPSIIHLVENRPFVENNILPNGAIGKMNSAGKTKYMELFADRMAGLKILFYPNNKSLIYVKYPYCENLYVSVEEYFSYMKKQLVSELEMMAHNLGAKHVKITYSERKNNNGLFQANGNANIRKVGAKIDAKREYENGAAVEILSIETEAKEKMKEKLDEEDALSEADRFAQMSVWEIYQPLVTGVSSEYTLDVEFEE